MTIRRSSGYAWPYSNLSKQTLGFKLPSSDLVVPNDQIIVPANGTYSQSSLYFANAAADATSMTNGSIADTTKTATDTSGLQWIKIDYGSPKIVRSIVLGDYTGSLVGGWGSNGIYMYGADVQTSMDDSSWITIFTLQSSLSTPVAYPTYTFTANTGVFTISLPATGVARYVRLARTGYLACTEFYATST